MAKTQRAEQKDAEMAFRFLSHVSEILSSSRDLRRLLPHLAALTVRSVADYFVVDLFDDAGQMHRAVEMRSNRLASSVPPPAGSPPGALTLSLQARGSTLGRMTLWRDGARPFGTMDRKLAGELAARIALAVETARLYERMRRIADTLQRALLPAKLPELPGVALHAAYVPATNEAEVGGDWYDAFLLPNAELALSIGDVAGHGLEAAVIMGEVRHTLRMAAFELREPAAVLDRANRLLLLREEPVMVTAIFGTFNRSTSSFTYATAGHPPPALGLIGGPPQTLPFKGAPLGVVREQLFRTWTVSLPPGSVMALYTDGLLEFERNMLDAEDRLLHALDDVVVQRPLDPAERLLSSVLQTSPNLDDIAILALRVADAPVERLDLSFSATPLASVLVRQMIGRLAESLGLAPDETFSLQVGVGEAVNNVVEHAYLGSYGTVRIRSERAGGRLLMSIEDNGRWRPTREEGRGRGLPIMRSLMDGVEIQLTQTGTVVRLTYELERRLHARAPH